MKKYTRRHWLARVTALGLTSFGGAFAWALDSKKVKCKTTPSQVLGPFYPEKWTPNNSSEADLTMVKGAKSAAKGQKISLTGEVVDQNCLPIKNAKVQLWQANHLGRYHHKNDSGNKKPLDSGFAGAAEVKTNESGQFSFTTIRPGTYKAGFLWTRPAHLHFKVIKDGFDVLVTQMYFTGDPFLKSDNLLAELTEKEKAKLIVDFQFDKSKKLKVGNFKIELKKNSTKSGHSKDEA